MPWMPGLLTGLRHAGIIDPGTAQQSLIILPHRPLSSYLVFADSCRAAASTIHCPRRLCVAVSQGKLVPSMSFCKDQAWRQGAVRWNNKALPPPHPSWFAGAPDLANRPEFGGPCCRGTSEQTNWSIICQNYDMKGWVPMTSSHTTWKSGNMPKQSHHTLLNFCLVSIDSTARNIRQTLQSCRWSRNFADMGRNWFSHLGWLNW